MADSSRNCPSCGAHVPAGTDQCDLCGTPVPSDDPSGDGPSGDDSPGDDLSAASEAPSGSGEASTIYCTECGSENPAGAKYCSRCGTELRNLSGDAPEGTRAVAADLPEGPSDPEASSAEAAADVEEEAGAAGRQILWMVGLGLCLVLGFFFVTQWSQEYDWGGGEGGGPPAAASESGGGAAGPAAGGSGPATSGTPQGGAGDAVSEADLESLVQELGGPVEGPVADEIDSLRAIEDEVEGQQRREVRTQLVRMYTGAGAPGQAALVQRQLADATGSVDDRRRAADLLYRWMRQVEQQEGRTAVTEVARHVASAYEAVANERPEDLDARTRMGEAYLLTNNPMKGIRAINDVLEADSTFVPARFQKGLALLQINRLDQALGQFRAVREFAGEGDPFYKQAGRAIEVIEKQRARSSGSSSGAGS